MKKFPFFLVLCCIVGTARADPTLYVPGIGDPNIAESGREVCWSEPADLNGLIGSSEQILALGLETELANDFVPTDAVSHATWWGGFYNNTTPCASGITTPGFNLRFYEDAGCVPGTLIGDYAVTNFTEESVGCQQGIFPMFKWQTDATVNLVGGNLYWFGAQMRDHAFPPQAGRLAAGLVTGCDTVFRSAYFGYPDWTPAIDVFGVAFDASQEFECSGIGGLGACCFPDGHCEMQTPIQCGGDYQGWNIGCDPNPCVPSPAKTSTWSQIKGAYR